MQPEPCTNCAMLGARDAEARELLAQAVSEHDLVCASLGVETNVEGPELADVARRIVEAHDGYERLASTLIDLLHLKELEITVLRQMYGDTRDAATGLRDVLQEVAVAFAIPEELRTASEIVGKVHETVEARNALAEAVIYTLDRAQTDPDLGYYVGPGTQAFYLLCKGEAAHSGLSLELVERRRGTDQQPPHAKRAPMVVELQKRIQELQG